MVVVVLVLMEETLKVQVQQVLPILVVVAVVFVCGEEITVWLVGLE
jgi:hypothetical protein